MRASAGPIDMPGATRCSKPANFACAASSSDMLHFRNVDLYFLARPVCHQVYDDPWRGQVFRR